MNILKIAALPNGAHENQTFHDKIPVGWAIIPDGMTLKNFPFGEVETEEIGGVVTVTKWTPGKVPEAKPKQKHGANAVLNVLLGVTE